MADQLNAQDFFGQAIILKESIRQFRESVTVSVCREHPLLVVMALADLESKADAIVAEMREGIAKASPPSHPPD